MTVFYPVTNGTLIQAMLQMIHAIASKQEKKHPFARLDGTVFLIKETQRGV